MGFYSNLKITNIRHIKIENNKTHELVFNNTFEDFIERSLLFDIRFVIVSISKSFIDKNNGQIITANEIDD